MTAMIPVCSLAYANKIFNKKFCYQNASSLLVNLDVDFKVRILLSQKQFLSLSEDDCVTIFD